MGGNRGEPEIPSPTRDREQELIEVLAAYLEAVESGVACDPDVWVARYPHFADELERFLTDQHRLLDLTAPLRHLENEDATIDPQFRSDQGSNRAPRETSALSPPPPDRANGPARNWPLVKVRDIGDYELLGEIARGGMGVVFRARQRSLNRTVALKMLLAGPLMTLEDEERFRQEAEAAANLDHPHIIPIYEVGRYDGHFYFSMKLVEGGSLAQRLSDFGADQRAAAGLMAMVARAVHHAHQRGVLHRDLKPANILLSAPPGVPLTQVEPLVADFGLAKRVDADSELTQSGSILGTPSYMAPEQASGKKRLVTVATDVYGLGAILYTILSGKPPFRGESALETLAQVCDQSPAAPSNHGKRVDRDLETICLKCLEKEPASRYGSAKAVAEDLERWLAGKAIDARPTGPAERVWRWCRRKPVMAALCASMAALLTILLAGLLISNRLVSRERGEARNRALASRRNDFVRDVKYASELLEGNRLSSAIELLSRYDPAPGGEDLRDFAWRYLWQAAHAGSPPLRGHSGEVYHAEFSPDGRTLATSSQDKTVRLWDVANRTTRLIIGAESGGHTDEINWVTYSPDGASLATASDDQTVRIWDAATGQSLATLTGHHDKVVAAVYTPDGKLLVSVGRDGQVITWDHANSRESRSFSVSNGTIQSLAISPDGKTLAFAGKRVLTCKLPDGRDQLRLSDADEQVNAVAFSHDGKMLASGGIAGVVRLWDVASAKKLANFDGHRTDVQSVSFSPDDQTLASVDDDGLVYFWSSATGGYRTIATGYGRGWCVAFSRDGATVAMTSNDQNVTLWDLTRDLASEIRSGELPIPPSMACLADTKTFAIADMRGGLSLNGARVTAMDSQSSARVVSARLSPDGTRLLTVDTDGLVSLTSVPDGRRISNFSKSVDVIHRLGISPKGTHVVMITKNGTGIVRETASAHEKRIFAGDVSSLSFSAHGEYLAFGGWGAVRPILWEFATGQSHRLEGLGHSTGIQAVTFSADSRLLATGGKDNTIILWDCRSDRQITRLSGHMAAVTALAFSPGGTILASGDSESTVRLWDLPSERELTILRGHSGGVAQLDFSADETILASIGLASGGYRYNAIVWSAVPIK